jgi:hypothetical protein
MKITIKNLAETENQGDPFKFLKGKEYFIENKKYIFNYTFSNEVLTTDPKKKAEIAEFAQTFINRRLGSNLNPLTYMNLNINTLLDELFKIETKISPNLSNLKEKLASLSREKEYFFNDFYRYLFTTEIKLGEDLDRAINQDFSKIFNVDNAKDVLFCKNALNELTNYNNEKTRLPFYNEITIPVNKNNTTTELSTLCETDTHVSNLFLEYYKSTSQLLLTFSKDETTNDILLKQTTFSNEIFVNKDIPNTLKIYKSNENSTVLFNPPKKPLSDKIHTMDTTDSELIFVVLEKYVDRDVVPIQNFYFYVGNFTDNSIAFIDNQIHIDKKYRYAVKYVYFNKLFKYFYQERRNVEDYSFNLLQIENAYNLLEVPFYEQQISVKDIAPVKVAMNIFTEYNKSDYIKILLETYSAKIENPFGLTESENQYFADLKTQNNGLVSFQDTNFTSFEIFRIEKEPFSFQDFAGEPYLILQSSMTAFSDKIKPNTNYYYVIRTKKVGGVSDLSDIYSVKIIYENGAIIPRISLHKLKTLEEKVLESTIKTKTFNKFVKISPSLVQAMVQEAAGMRETYKNSTIRVMPDTQNFKILNEIWQNNGDISENINKLRFKVRITSRSTGKKLDINLNFANIVKNKFEE